MFDGHVAEVLLNYEQLSEQFGGFTLIVFVQAILDGLDVVE